MLTGKLDKRYVDIATVYIGLYCAASGMSLEECLRVQNTYAKHLSKMKDREFDPVYTYLPRGNVENTELGYRLFESGSIGDKSRL